MLEILDTFELNEGYEYLPQIWSGQCNVHEDTCTDFTFLFYEAFLYPCHTGPGFYYVFTRLFKVRGPFVQTPCIEQDSYMDAI